MELKEPEGFNGTQEPQGYKETHGPQGTRRIQRTEKYQEPQGYQ
jgi:hypothetical protein